MPAIVEVYVCLNLLLLLFVHWESSQVYNKCIGNERGNYILEKHCATEQSMVLKSRAIQIAAVCPLILYFGN